MIQAQYPNVDITNEGEADFVIEYEPALQPSQTAEYAKQLFYVCWFSLERRLPSWHLIMTFL